MKRAVLTVGLFLAAVAAASIPNTETGFVYHVASVKRQLFLITAGGETQLQPGDQAHSGDSLRTGRRSSAELEVKEESARFLIDAKTRFSLADDRPGVLIEVERGSLRAIFGTLVDGDDHERLVITPSAVLAVRGTDYGVEVEKDGDTSVMVFEGTVEVSDPQRGEVVMVHAGQASRIRTGRSPSKPEAHGMSSGDWQRGRRVGSGGQSGGQQAPSMGSGSQGGSGQPKQSSQGGSKRRGG